MESERETGTATERARARFFLPCGALWALTLACGSTPGSGIDSSDNDVAADVDRDLDIAGDTPPTDADVPDAVDDSDRDADLNDGVDVDAPDVDADLPPDADTTWEPPFDGFGEPGWRESDEPLCRPDSERPRAYSLWADQRGVFVTASLAGGVESVVVLGNDGTGWVEFASVEESGASLAGRALIGVPGGKLWLLVGGRGCWEFDPSSRSLTPCADAVLRTLAAMDDGTAYGLIPEAPGLVFFDGTEWGAVPGDPMPFDPANFTQLHVADGVVFVGGANGTVLTWSGGAWTVHRLGTMEEIAALWALGARDAWVSTHAGELFHYDGESWTSVEWGGDPVGSCPTLEIEHMWGSDGVLYYATGMTFGRIVAGVPETVARWTGATDEPGWCEGGLWINVTIRRAPLGASAP